MKLLNLLSFKSKREHENSLQNLLHAHTGKIEELSRELEKTKHALFLERLLFKQGLEYAKPAVLILYADEKVFFANKAFRGMLDIPEAHPITMLSQCFSHTQNTFMFMHGDIKESLKQSAATKKPFCNELMMHSQKEKIFSFSAQSLWNKNNLAGYFLEFHDVTALAHLEKAKADFVATISHELRAPLNSIKGFTLTLLRDISLSPKQQKELLAIINQQTDKLISIIGSFLDMSQIESGHLVLKRQPVDVKTMAKEIMAQARQKKSLRVSIKTEKDIPYAFADPTKVHQILSNLLDNAAKYSPADGRITLLFAKRGNTVYVSVEDEGPGIPEEHLSHIFEKFYRVDNSLTREVGGMGIGLHLCWNYVKAHGGKIYAKSPLSMHPVTGKPFGTSITFTLPAVLQKKEEAQNILVVDDDPLMLKLMRLNFNGENIKIEEARDGEEALQKVMQLKPRVIILDIMMPKCDGFDVLRKIKNQSETANVPVIIVSAKDREEDSRLGLQLGAHRYIVKPLNPVHLVEEVKALLEEGTGNY